MYRVLSGRVEIYLWSHRVPNPFNENSKHFFLDCSIYLQARTKLIDNINTTCYSLDIKFLTRGNDNLTYEQNCIIFKYVFDYTKCSKRFLIVITGIDLGEHAHHMNPS